MLVPLDCGLWLEIHILMWIVVVDVDSYVDCDWRCIVLCGLWLLRNPTSVGDIAEMVQLITGLLIIYTSLQRPNIIYTAMQSDIVYTLKHHQYNQLHYTQYNTQLHYLYTQTHCVMFQ